MVEEEQFAHLPLWQREIEVKKAKEELTLSESTVVREAEAAVTVDATHLTAVTI